MLKFVVITLYLSVSTASEYGYGSIGLPVKSYHDVKVIHAPSHREEHKTQVVVKASDLPVHMTFKSQSSPVYVKQQHKGTKGSYHKTDSKDEPHQLVHEVIKPVYQEIKEIIKPYRKVIQVIEPVKEERLTKVHKSEYQGGYNGEGYGKGGNNGYDQKYEKYDIDEEYIKQEDNKYQIMPGYDSYEDQYGKSAYDEQQDGKKYYQDDHDTYKSDNNYHIGDFNNNYKSNYNYKMDGQYRGDYNSNYNKLKGALAGL